MANPSGANSPTSYQPTETVPYGEKKRQGDLARTAPVAGQQQTNQFLGTPRAATEAALANSPPVTAAPQPQAQAPNPLVAVAQKWAEIAAEPGANALVHEYAARAAAQAQ